MKPKLVLCAVFCVLCSICLGQWVEKSIGLPDSLSGLRNPGLMLYNPGSNVLFISGSNGLLLVDGLSNRVVARTPLTDFGSAARCYASQVNKVYWVGGGYNDNEVYSLDGASGRVLARISVSSPDDICYNPVVNKVYVLGGSESSSLTVINAAKDSIVRTLTLGGQWATSVCCNPGDNKVYFTLYDNGTVGVIDCDVDTIRRSISVSVEPDGLVYNRVSNKLYCYSYDTLTIIDGHSDSIIKRVALNGSPTQVAYNPTANKLYCADHEGIDIICGYGDTLLARVEPGSRTWGFAFDSTDNLMWYSPYYESDTLIAIDGQGDTLCGVVATGNTPYDLCYNPTRNRLYASQNQLAVIDPAAKRVEQRILLSFTPTALCWAKSANKVYCAGSDEASVAVISSQQNLLLRLIPVGQDPRALVYDRPLGVVCCANYRDSTVSIITCNGDSVTGTVAVRGRPDQLCVDTILHKAWCLTAGGAAVIDLRAESLTAVLPLSGTEALLADPAHGRVWCATGNDGHVVVLDAAGDSIIATIPVGGEASALCLIPNANLVGCATQSNNAIAVIDGATNRMVNIIPVGESPQALLYNQRRNKLYCANGGSDDVTVVDCSTLTPVATIPAGRSPEALAYDSTGDRVYWTNPYDDEVTVISCRRDSVVARIPVGSNPVAMAYASTQRRMFVANQDGSSLSVIRDTARVGVEEGLKDEGGRMNVGPTIVRGVLFLEGDCPRMGTVPKAALLDISGRKVLDLKPGANDVCLLAPGVYFIRPEPSAVSREPLAVTKVVIAR